MGSSNILIKLVLEGFTKAKAQMNNLGKTTDDSSGKLNKFGTVAKVGAIAVGTVLVKALSEASAPLAQRMYEEEAKNNEATQQDAPNSDSDVVDADFEEVTEEKEKQSS